MCKRGGKKNETEKYLTKENFQRKMGFYTHREKTI